MNSNQSSLDSSNMSLIESLDDFEPNTNFSLIVLFSSKKYSEDSDIVSIEPQDRHEFNKYDLMTYSGYFRDILEQNDDVTLLGVPKTPMELTHILTYIRYLCANPDVAEREFPKKLKNDAILESFAETFEIEYLKLRILDEQGVSIESIQHHEFLHHTLGLAMYFNVTRLFNLITLCIAYKVRFLNEDELCKYFGGGVSEEEKKVIEEEVKKEANDIVSEFESKMSCTN